LAATRSSIAAARPGGDCAHAGVSDQTPRAVPSAAPSATCAANADLMSAAPARRIAVCIIVSVSKRAGWLTRAADLGWDFVRLKSSILDRLGSSYFGFPVRFRPPVWRFRSPHHSVPRVRDADF